jgi:hypothetical protein
MSKHINTSKNNTVIKVLIVASVFVVLGLSLVIFQQVRQNVSLVEKNSSGENAKVAQDAQTVISESGVNQLIEDTYSPLLQYAKNTGKLKTEVAAGVGPRQLDKETITELNDLSTYLQTEGTTYINAEVVSLWFNNYFTEKYTLEQRRNMAQQLMQDLREKVSNGTLTMKQAGEMLINDTSLKDIDTAWQANSYREVTFAKKDERTFLDPTIEKTFWTMQKGELSPLLVGHLVDAPGSPEGSFTFIKINEREDKEYDTYNQFVKENK